MVQCPICLKYVLAFKSGCHVIPRWLLILTKDNRGKYFEISSNKNGRGQKDIKTESWCEICERGFANLDCIGALFFRDNVKFLIEAKNQFSKYVFNKVEDCVLVKNFVSSIIVRYYLYRLKNRQIVNEPALNEVYKAFLAGRDLHIFLHDMRKFLLSTVSIPVVSKGTVQLIINGFLVVVTSDSGISEQLKLQENEIVIHHIHDANNAYVKNFNELIRRAKLAEKSKLGKI